ncbi:MAG: TonB-dependent receptor [Melioribacteraceae bacterium]|nr:TonB-dependent receptor [Melioribacteraceae bacterium]
MSRFYKFLTVMLLFTTASVFAQTYTVSGVVKSSETGENLVGANVFVKGTTTGAASDVDGKYSIPVEDGEYTIVCSYIGYEKQEVEVNVTNNMELDFELSDYQFSLNVTVLADRAKERETPVAFTNIDKKEMEQMLGSRDIPMLLNTAPSTYATLGGGGAGDGRVNVRGFDQRNVAVMINGVPVNDMEWGWVYWSNWDGVGDAAGSLQLQRGLSATTLSTPSIGGSMNLVSEPTSQNFGIHFKQEFGDASFLKSSLSAASGLIDGKWAFNTTVVRKTGDGLIDGAWTDSWSYYFGAAYNLNDDNRIELYALGAPQRHGQRSYRLNIGAFSHDFARGLKTYSKDALADPRFAEQGLKYNCNWNTLTTDYSGEQYWNGSTHERYDENFMNERENYYHKPQVNLNWYSKLSSKLSLYTTAYYSGGVGGGSGTFGSMAWDYSLRQRVLDFDGSIAKNIANGDGGSRGILRNSVNEQWAIGAISKAIYKINDNLNATVGIDWRTGEVDHYREVRDLLGGAFYSFDGNEFDTEAQYKKVLGDRMDYDFTNKIDWIGTFAQAEYTDEKVSAFGMVGWNTKKYGYTNHFKKGADGGELEAETDNFSGYQFKGGASYRINENLMVYGNGGYVASVPIFDNTINDRTGDVFTEVDNEIFTSFEGGLQFNTNNFAATIAYYHTKWEDRATTVPSRINEDDEGLVLISGIDQLNKGWEFSMSFLPIKQFRLDASAWLGDWYLTDDVDAVFKDYSGNGNADQEFQAYVKNIKVGDMPQAGLTFTATVMPIKGASVALVVHTYRSHYAAWDPFDRTNQADAEIQPWKIPSHTVADLHMSYDIPVKLYGVGLQVFGHVFNVFDEVYISDATDNSPYNSFDKDHDADDAEVYFGLPRNINFGVRLSY